MHWTRRVGRAVLAVLGVVALSVGGLVAFTAFEVEVSGAQLLSGLKAAEPELAAEYKSGTGDGMVQMGMEGISWFDLDVRCGRPVTRVVGGDVNGADVYLRAAPKFDEMLGPDDTSPLTLAAFREDAAGPYTEVIGSEATTTCTRAARRRIGLAGGLVVVGLGAIYLSVVRPMVRGRQATELSPPPPA